MRGVEYVRELGGDPYFFAGETCLFDRAAHGGFGSWSTATPRLWI